MAAACLPIVQDVLLDDFNHSPPCFPLLSVAVNTFGFPAGYHIIEDITHSFGATRGSSVVPIGACAVASLGATKPLSGGSGGIVLGPRDLCDDARDRRDYDGKRDFRQRFNWQMSDINAALVLSQLKRLDEQLALRRRMAELYDKHNPFDRQRAVGDAEPSWYRYVLRVPEGTQQKVIAALADAGVGAIVPIEPWELLHRQLGLDPKDYPVAEQIARTTVSIPIHPGMAWEDAQVVARALEGLG
jgi:perosamine synthetase